MSVAFDMPPTETSRILPAPQEEEQQQVEALFRTSQLEPPQGGTYDFLDDDPSQMTASRRMALFLMKRFKWYNPKLGTEAEEQTVDDSGNNNNNNNETSPLQQGGSFTSFDSPSAPPSLESAWAYFEHFVLPRYVHQPQRRSLINLSWWQSPRQLLKAKVGEKNVETRLYPMLTSHKELGDWGLGIGLYFQTLLGFFFVMIFAGFLNIPNLVYFNGAEYSAHQVGVRTILKGSAVCTQQSWVPCPDCNREDFPPDRFGIATLANMWNTTTEGIAAVHVTVVKKNNCEGATLQQGMINYGTLFLVIIGTIIINKYLSKVEIEFDENEQTAQDYSIVIENPPKDAYEPEEWKEFFRTAFDDTVHVTACTVGVGNDILVRYLVQRREVMKLLEQSVPAGTSLDMNTFARMAAKQIRDRTMLDRCLAYLSPGVPEYYDQLVVLRSKIRGLAQLDYPVSNVFVTFETEKQQRDILSKLSVGTIQSWNNIGKYIREDKKYLFRGEHVLLVYEPEEPGTIRWKDLSQPLAIRIRERCLTFLATIVILILAAYAVYRLDKHSKYATTYTIAIFNTMFPMFAQYLTDFEAYKSESDKQLSLYSKLTLFRWINTAVVYTLIEPFTHSLDKEGGIIDNIGSLFFAEILTNNVLQYTNIWGNMKRHYFAPRAVTQDAMNMNMQGSDFPLADCYTTMSKLIFLTLWYSAIYPTAFFYCSAALLISYVVDKHSLLREWCQSPRYGSSISRFNRKYALIAITIMSIISSYYWSAFPFDNLCLLNEEGKTDADDVDTETYYRNTVSEFIMDKDVAHLAQRFATKRKSSSWNVQPLAEGYPPISVTMDHTSPVYQYCIQDFFDARNLRFPFISKYQDINKKWMTSEQELLTDIYGWTSVAIIALTILVFLWLLKKTVFQFLRGTYKASGKDQSISFTDALPSISLYVPQVDSNIYNFPLLAVNVDNIDPILLSWTDPARPHSFYDLTRDAEMLLQQQHEMARGLSCDNAFSRIAHWPAQTQQQTEDGVEEEYREQESKTEEKEE